MKNETTVMKVNGLLSFFIPKKGIFRFYQKLYFNGLNSVLILSLISFGDKSFNRL